MTTAATKSGTPYTWTDYCSWDDGQRWELIGGEAVAMSPSPASRHQWVSAELQVCLHDFFKQKSCRLFNAPMDVKLSDFDVVQPDLLVVCDPSQVKATIEGPPALVIEILSEHSIQHDRIRKMELYARYGVKEYWIVTPFPSLVEIYLLQGERYVRWNAYAREDELTSPSFPGLSVNLQNVFDFPLEPHEKPAPVVKEPPTAPYRTADK
jgi:Uma2 family endonuclease